MLAVVGAVLVVVGSLVAGTVWLSSPVEPLLRPAGLGTADRAILRMVDELRWLDRFAEGIDRRAGVIAARAASPRRRPR